MLFKRAELFRELNYLEKEIKLRNTDDSLSLTSTKLLLSKVMLRLNILNHVLVSVYP